jgi:hypothetical protein
MSERLEGTYTYDGATEFGCPVRKEASTLIETMPIASFGSQETGGRGREDFKQAQAAQRQQNIFYAAVFDHGNFKHAPAPQKPP